MQNVLMKKLFEKPAYFSNTLKQNFRGQYKNKEIKPHE